MADKTVTVRIVGLAQLNSALRGLSDKVASDVLRSSLLGIAGIVATKVRAKVPHGASGHAAGSIQPHATSRGASISYGGQAAPYMPWLDFGGSTGRGHRIGVAWSGSIRREWTGKPSGSGRYIYPTISEEREATIDAVEAAIIDAARAADFEVH